MNFFDAQERAQRHSAWLVIMFAVGIALSILALYSAAIGIVTAREWTRAPNRGHSTISTGFWQPTLFACVAGGALTVIATGSLYKIAQLRGGGAALAERMGGTRIEADTQDAAEKCLLNIVQEMAIASGMPVPDVFVLRDEDAINAFAAGHTQADAAIAVTDGCLRILNRDQLQGVIGHEFSHILHGDMRLNIRLIGILNGILIIGMIGMMILRSLGRGSVRSSRRESGGGLIAIVLAGAALSVIGYVGLFFGRLIKAAVSRQREFLADAASVQYTRNPDGLAGALAQIARSSYRSFIKTPNAEEASHMFFGNALGEELLFASLLATHPPVQERIRRIDPMFNLDSVPDVPLHRRAPSDDLYATAMGIGPGAVTPVIGAPAAADFIHSARLLRDLPAPLRAATQDPLGAVGLTLALLLDEGEAARSQQLAALKARAPEPIYREVLRAFDRWTSAGSPLALPLIDLSASALRRLSPRQAAEFRDLVALLIECDHTVTLFEFAVQKILDRRLPDNQGHWPLPELRYYSVGKLLPDCVLILSLLSRADGKDGDEAQHAFDAGLARLPHPRGDASLSLRSPEQCSVAAVHASLDRMAASPPAVKERIINACAFCVMADRVATRREIETLRAISASLGCPLSPFFDRCTGNGPVAGNTATESG